MDATTSTVCPHLPGTAQWRGAHFTFEEWVSSRPSQDGRVAYCRATAARCAWPVFCLCRRRQAGEARDDENDSPVELERGQCSSERALSAAFPCPLLGGLSFFHLSAARAAGQMLIVCIRRRLFSPVAPRCSTGPNKKDCPTDDAALGGRRNNKHPSRPSPRSGPGMDVQGRLNGARGQWSGISPEEDDMRCKPPLAAHSTRVS